MKRTEKIETVVVFAGLEECDHKFVQGPSESLSATSTRMHFICSGCLREEKRTRTFVLVADPEEYTELKKLDKSKAVPYAKPTTAGNLESSAAPGEPGADFGTD